MGHPDPVFAAWYQVEVIIFEYTEPEPGGESWYENPGLPERDNSIAPITVGVDGDGAGKMPGPGSSDSPGETDLMPYLALPKEYYRLDGVNKVLKLSKEYRPLLHIAWQQPGLDGRAVRSVHLDNILFEEKSEKQPGVTWLALEEGGASPGRTPTGGVPADGNRANLAEPGMTSLSYAPPTMVYDGFIRLRRSRLLHLDVDFAYFPELTEEPDVSLSGTDDEKSLLHQPADYVRLTESRRIRLNEIHYFDHPMFGLIIQVRRIKN